MNQFWLWIHKILPQAPTVHAVGLAAIIWAIWRTQNAVRFDKKRVKYPTEIVCLICSFLTYWTGLLEEDLKDQVIQGAKVVKAATLFFHMQDLQAHSLEERQIVPFAG
jgi:hypothetical protein